MRLTGVGECDLFAISNYSLEISIYRPLSKTWCFSNCACCDEFLTAVDLEGHMLFWRMPETVFSFCGFCCLELLDVVAVIVTGKVTPLRSTSGDKSSKLSTTKLPYKAMRIGWPENSKELSVLIRVFVQSLGLAPVCGCRSITLLCFAHCDLGSIQESGH